MIRNYRRRPYNYPDVPENVIETSCNCVQNNMFAEKNECDCGFDEDMNPFPSRPEFGQSYVPIQYMNKTFIPSVALHMGTLFPELVSPYEPCQSIAEIAYIKAHNEIKGGCNNERV